MPQKQPYSQRNLSILGYVINVIEEPQERREALQKAWALTEGVLLVAAQVLVRDRDEDDVVYGDGVVTQRGTFQKYYEQEELKAYIDGVLGVDAIPVGLGVYAVFRAIANSRSNFAPPASVLRATLPVCASRFSGLRNLGRRWNP